MDKLTLKVKKWQGGSGYKYTDITLNNITFYTIIETNSPNEFIVQHKDIWGDNNTTYEQALKTVADLIIKVINGKAT